MKAGVPECRWTKSVHVSYAVLTGTFLTSSINTGVVADVGATTLLVLARDGTASTDSLAVRSGFLGDKTEGKDSDREDGGELHSGVDGRF
jgi:hypothetical protein